MLLAGLPTENDGRERKPKASGTAITASMTHLVVAARREDGAAERGEREEGRHQRPDGLRVPHEGGAYP